MPLVAVTIKANAGHGAALLGVRPEDMSIGDGFPRGPVRCRRLSMKSSRSALSPSWTSRWANRYSKYNCPASPGFWKANLCISASISTSATCSTVVLKGGWRPDCPPSPGTNVHSAAARRFASLNARHTRSGRSGNSSISIPNGRNASQTALVRAPGTAPGIPSPRPRLPSGVYGHGVPAS